MTSEIDSADVRAVALTVRCPVCHINPGHRCTIRLARGYHQRRIQKAIWRQRAWRPAGAGGRYICAVCGKPISKARTHILTETDIICCTDCVFYDSKDAHTVAYPHCPIAWHDMYDHGHLHCTLAGLRYLVSSGGFSAHCRKTPPPREA